MHESNEWCIEVVGGHDICIEVLPKGFYAKGGHPNSCPHLRAGEMRKASQQIASRQAEGAKTVK